MSLYCHGNTYWKTLITWWWDKAGTVAGLRLMWWQDLLKERWRSSSSLRSSGKTWSEQAGHSSHCLIRTDVTKHNPSQQSVLKLEQVIFEKKVQAVWEGATLCSLIDCESWCMTSTDPWRGFVILVLTILQSSGRDQKNQGAHSQTFWEAPTSENC